MSKKKHKRDYDSYDMSLDEKLDRIYDDCDEQSSNTGLQELLNNVGDSVIDTFDNDAEPEMPVVETKTSAEGTSPHKVSTNPVIDSLSVIEPKMGNDSIFPTTVNPTPSAFEKQIGEMFDSDDDDDDDEPELPEMRIDLVESNDKAISIVRFTDGINCVTVNLTTILNDAEHKRVIPNDKLADLAKNVTDACITSMMPLKIMPEAEYTELVSMIGNFDHHAYRICDMSRFDSNRYLAIYKMAAGFDETLAKIIDITAAHNATAFFLAVLQDSCFKKHIMWNTTTDFLQFSGNTEIDFDWDVFFKTDGVDPISSAGKHLSIEELKAELAKSTVSLGMFWDPLIDFGDSKTDDSEDDDSDEDDESDEGTETNELASDIVEMDEEDTESLAKELEEGLESESVEVEAKSETVSVAPDSTSRYESDELVLDVIRRKDTH